MKTQSIWEYSKKESCKSLENDIDVDVLIAGGGLTGLSTMYELRNSGLAVSLVERNICGRGVTSKSTAKITYLQDNTITSIANLVGYKQASIYLQSQLAAAQNITNIIEDEHIDCDLQECDSYLFTAEEKNVKKLDTIREALSSEGIKVQDMSEIPFNEKFISAIKVNKTYVFHPLKYIDHLKELFKSNIYEHSKLESIDYRDHMYYCQVNGHIVKSKYVVLATHYPYFIFPCALPLKTHIEVSYLGAKKVDKFLNFSAINIDKPTISMRYHTDENANYLIYLYGSHMSSNVQNIKENFEKLKSRRELDYIWSNNDIITNDYIPYIGRIKDNLLIATGYNTWGMTNGSFAGRVIADIILDRENEYTSLFDPKRNINFSKIIRFPIDVGASATSFIKSGKNNTNNSCVTYEKRNGVSVAIYKDEKGIEHVVLDRCPHMKCGIVFNEVEKTWDCLCHGSRFSLDGKCIEGPSNFDISYKDPY